jgi:hypothetical protein
VRLIIGLLLLGIVVPAAFTVLAGYTTPVLEAGVRAAESMR